MNRTQFLAGRLREVLLNGQWIANTNYMQQITSVSWQQATRKIGDLNTIAVLVYHVNYYLAGLLNVFNEGKLEISDKYSFDAPAITSEDDWSSLVNTFLTNAENFADKVAEMQDAQLDEAFVDEKYGTWMRNLEGVIEHSYYHLGQISLIRKLLPENESGVKSTK